MPDLLERLGDRLLIGDGCWDWTGALNNNGYANVRADGKTESIHRVLYKLLVGPIPDGHDLDHDCHNEDPSCPGGRACVHRRCANPAHMTPRTRQANLAASPHGAATRTECPNGHPYDEANTYLYRGKRQCRACRTVRDRSRSAR